MFGQHWHVCLSSDSSLVSSTMEGMKSLVQVDMVIQNRVTRITYRVTSTSPIGNIIPKVNFTLHVDVMTEPNSKVFLPSYTERPVHCNQMGPPVIWGRLWMWSILWSIISIHWLLCLCLWAWQQPWACFTMILKLFFVKLLCLLLRYHMLSTGGIKAGNWPGENPAEEDGEWCSRRWGGAKAFAQRRRSAGGCDGQCRRFQQQGHLCCCGGLTCIKLEWLSTINYLSTCFLNLIGSAKASYWSFLI